MTCCGKPMAPEGDKVVCGTCGAWFAPGYSDGGTQ